MTDRSFIPFKGLIRFSYLAATTGRPKGEIDQAALDRNFTPDRMELQLALFNYFTLPSLRRQTDQGFTAVVLTSKGLPDRVLDLLLGLTDPMPNLTVLTLPPLPLAAAAGRAFRMAEPAPGATHSATFRVEEGTALADDVLARQRARALARIAEGRGDAPFLMSLNRGYALDLSAAPGDRLQDVAYRTPQPSGLTLVAPATDRMHVCSHGLERFPQEAAYASDLGAPAFLRASMAQADISGKSAPAKPEEDGMSLSRLFGLSHQELEFG